MSCEHSAEQRPARAAAVRRRRGRAPAERASCSRSRDFAVLGEDVGGDPGLPPDAGRAETERVVVVPRAVFLAAVRDLSGGV
jgi:hypothetical protein